MLLVALQAAAFGLALLLQGKYKTKATLKSTAFYFTLIALAVVSTAIGREDVLAEEKTYEIMVERYINTIEEQGEVK